MSNQTIPNTNNTEVAKAAIAWEITKELISISGDEIVEEILDDAGHRERRQRLTDEFIEVFKTISTRIDWNY